MVRSIDFFKIYKDRVVCPRCDGNGLIYEVFIKQLYKHVYLCDECDALWEDPGNMTLNNFQDFTTYLRKYGVAYFDAQLESINYEWYKNKN